MFNNHNTNDNNCNKDTNGVNRDINNNYNNDNSWTSFFILRSSAYAIATATE